MDPGDRRALLCVVPLGDGRRAIATSGIAERGEHVWRRPVEPGDVPFVQVSVIAEDIVTADVLATAILAGGTPTLDTVTDRFDVDVSGRRPRHLDDVAAESFDLVVTLCDRAREVCPDFSGPARRMHWSIPDPATADAQGDEAFERAADEIDARVGHLLPVLATTPSPRG